MSEIYGNHPNESIDNISFNDEKANESIKGEVNKQVAEFQKNIGKKLMSSLEKSAAVQPKDAGAKQASKNWTLKILGSLLLAAGIAAGVAVAIATCGIGALAGTAVAATAAVGVGLVGGTLNAGLISGGLGCCGIALLALGSKLGKNRKVAPLPAQHQQAQQAQAQVQNKSIELGSLDKAKALSDDYLQKFERSPSISKVEKYAFESVLTHAFKVENNVPVVNNKLNVNMITTYTQSILNYNGIIDYDLTPQNVSLLRCAIYQNAAELKANYAVKSDVTASIEALNNSQIRQQITAQLNRNLALLDEDSKRYKLTAIFKAALNNEQVEENDKKLKVNDKKGAEAEAKQNIKLDDANKLTSLHREYKTSFNRAPIISLKLSNDFENFISSIFAMDKEKKPVLKEPLREDDIRECCDYPKTMLDANGITDCEFNKQNILLVRYSLYQNVSVINSKYGSADNYVKPFIEALKDPDTMQKVMAKLDKVQSTLDDDSDDYKRMDILKAALSNADVDELVAKRQPAKVAD